ncbi:MAG TPA: hypothetical protein VG318_15330 [Actinomycetota bacterium]|nr:hypothetical protein [Actinomycetota bacterium]
MSELEDTDQDEEFTATLAPEVLEAALKSKERLISSYRARLARAQQEARLIEQLLMLSNEPGADDAEVAPLTIAKAPQGRRLSPSRHPVVDEVAALLEAEGHPLHISEIMRLLEERKTVLPGKGNQANVIAHIRRDPRFVRPSRGVYGLVPWGLRASSGDDGPRRRIKKTVREA